MKIRELGGESNSRPKGALMTLSNSSLRGQSPIQRQGKLAYEKSAVCSGLGRPGPVEVRKSGAAEQLCNGASVFSTNKVGVSTVGVTQGCGGAE